MTKSASRTVPSAVQSAELAMRKGSPCNRHRKRSSLVVKHTTEREEENGLKTVEKQMCDRTRVASTIPAHGNVPKKNRI